MLVSIEGLIGAGKSTVLNRLRDLGYKVIEEPVEKWTFLERFYENPKKYALALQTQILLSFVDLEIPDELVFVERSPAVSRYVFANMLRCENTLSDEDMGLYAALYDTLTPWKPDVYVYLECPPDVCVNRQASRGDSYAISNEYMNELEKYYKLFFKYNDVTCIDATKTTCEIVEDILHIVDRTSSRTDFPQTDVDGKK